MTAVSNADATIPDVDSLAADLNVRARQIHGAIRLLRQDRSIPFIARYRREATGSLDERQLRGIEDALIEADRCTERRTAILKALQSRDIPADVLDDIRLCTDRQELERLYQPWKTKRQSRADLARKRGLGPLARILRQQTASGSRSSLLERFVRPHREVPDEKAALAGACDIVAEEWAADSDVRKWMLDRASHAHIASRVKRGKDADDSPFRDYFDHRERISRVPAHRLLAMLRGASEGVVTVAVAFDEDWILPRLERRFIRNPRFTFFDELRRTVRDCLRRLLIPPTQTAVLGQLRTRAEKESIEVFASSLRDLLMAPPAGAVPTLGVDPGFRSGCKIAVVNRGGSVLDTATIYPTAPRNETNAAAETLRRLIQEHAVQLVAIGNGTASRETFTFMQTFLRGESLEVQCAIVSEAGASIYSASELAAAEYPDLDVTHRGAVSIAHRLQDPLAELVKLDPATIGVGQYQHDVDQKELRRVLNREVESCVSRVGVDLNTASAPLLARVSGVGSAVAEQIVAYRNRHGRFENRQQLQDVPRLGPVAFEQASGFLRISDADNPLDATAVHPESYSVVNAMANRLRVTVKTLVEDATPLCAVDPADFVGDGIGLETITDILRELRQPGRDPRDEFRPVKFDDSVRSIEDLCEGMKLNGVVTNVTAFGAFVDLGIHQDGLLHVSRMADYFVRDPSTEVAVGQAIRVEIIDVDFDRGRISLSRQGLGRHDHST